MSYSDLVWPEKSYVVNREVRASGCLISTTGRLPGNWPPAPDNKQTLCAGRSKRPDTNVGEEPRRWDWEAVLIQSLPYQRVDEGLAAGVEILSGLIQ
jgi:hypothetical protein